MKSDPAKNVKPGREQEQERSPYVAPKVQSVKLSDEAAEALT